MTFPTAAVNTTNVDSSADDPSLSRADLLDTIQKLNQIIAHGSPATLAGNQTLSGVNTFSQSPVVPTAVAVDDAVGKGQMDAAILAATPGTATTSVAGTVVLASSAVAIAGTDNTKSITAAAMHAGKMVSSATVATTSGTAFDFTGIPPWVRRIKLFLRGVSTNGSSDLMIRLGTSGGFAVTGYSSYWGYIVNDTNANTAGSTSGFGVSGGNPISTINGILTLSLQDSSVNSWVQSHSMGDVGGTAIKLGGGSAALAGVLTALRLTTANGTDFFDAGSISIMWE